MPIRSRCCLSTLLVLPVTSVTLLAHSPASAQVKPERIYAYASVGDNHWYSKWLPMDSKATIDALFEYLARTHGIKRMYWRGESDRMWLQYFITRKQNVLYCDFWTDWERYLTDKVKTDELAVAAAKRNGMEIYIFDGLFDHGSQGDVGGCGIFPYQGEDQLRLEHPEWCPVDRWGESVCAGPIEFCYPEARKAIIARYVKHLTQYGYDGVSFYTYVENTGLRYVDEFGFNEPIVKEFKKRYGVDIRTEPFDKEAWYKLRGEYLTQFVREFHTALAKEGKKLSITIRPDRPNSPMGWPDPGAGMVYMDWERWANEGIVDEIFCWLGIGKQAFVKRLTEACKGKAVELTVLHGTDVAGDAWNPLFEAGVHPVYVVAPGEGIDKYALGPTTAEDLSSSDWRLRAQALQDVTDGTIKADVAAIARLADDPHVLVRRHALIALGTLNAADRVPLIESKLTDAESSVRAQAVVALSKVNGPDSPARIIAALEKDGHHQMKFAAIDALAAMKEAALPAILEGLRRTSEPVREVCIRALGQSGIEGAEEPLIQALKTDPDYRVRFYAVTGLAYRTDPKAIHALRKALDDREPTVHLWAAQRLGEKASELSARQATETLGALRELFLQYGDDCRREDASWGWRAIGNAILALGQPGKDFLEEMRAQKRDKWLAWEAYEVVYVPQVRDKATPCEEKDAVETHAKYAPAFPGRR